MQQRLHNAFGTDSESDESTTAVNWEDTDISDQEKMTDHRERNLAKIQTPDDLTDEIDLKYNNISMRKNK